MWKYSNELLQYIRLIQNGSSQPTSRVKPFLSGWAPWLHSAFLRDSDDYWLRQMYNTGCLLWLLKHATIFTYILKNKMVYTYFDLWCSVKLIYADLLGWKMSTLKLIGCVAIIIGCFALLYPRFMHPLVLRLFGLHKGKVEKEQPGERAFRCFLSGVHWNHVVCMSCEIQRLFNFN